MAASCKNSKQWLNRSLQETVYLIALLLALFSAPMTYAGSKSQSKLESFEDLKVFKKFLRTKTNVLVMFAKDEASAKPALSLLNEVAAATKGIATLATINCGKAKKLCKKLKSSPSPRELKHFKDGEFHKDYDRQDTVKSMINFLKDPAGELPWDEDSTANDVYHLQNSNELERLMKKSLKVPALVMFYAPWCGYCKRIKPDFAAAATELKGESMLAGMDVDQPHNQAVRTAFNITGFPTIMYFEKGNLKFKYGGENNKEGIVSWMRDPSPPKEEGATEAEWADEPSEVAHLTDTTFDPFIAAHNSSLVMFYAPWCGHCKKMKPSYTETAGKMKEEGIEGKLAAVDVTKNKNLGERFEIKGFPTLKYFKDGELTFEISERDGDKILAFMKDPKEPPPPPPPEKDWSEEETDVVHLTEEDFTSFLKKKKHVLVMFYAPWCGHCKRAKPHFNAASAKLRDNNKVAFAGVDCTKHNPVCQAHGVQGFPTLKYFNYGKTGVDYEGGREEKDFLAFMENPLDPKPPKQDGPSAQEQWAEHAGASSIIHIDSKENLDAIAEAYPSLLVMFYAPWCGHCQSMKPAFARAAERVINEGIGGKLGAVDATQARDVAGAFKIKGYPTLKYFKDGKESFEYGFGRDEESLVDFMRDPRAPPPPPEPEAEWHTLTKDVHFLDSASFDGFVAENENVLVMFYAPWCGYCKKIKPAYFEAAAELTASASQAKLVAVDATKERSLSEKYEIRGYPTLKHFLKGGAEIKDFQGARTKEGIIEAMKSLGQKDEL